MVASFVPGSPFDVNVDSVNMVNGNAILRFPLTSMPSGHAGMGLDITLQS